MYHITLLPGNGIGPEIIEAVKKVLLSLDVKIKWEIFDADKIEYEENLNRFLDSCKNTTILLKGPLEVAKGGSYVYSDWSLHGKLEMPQSYPTINNLFRRVLECHYGVRVAKSYEGVPSKYKNVNLVIIRELSEDVYIASEYSMGDSAVALKVTSKKATKNLCNFCLSFLEENKRKKITIAHKANVLKLTDGLFLRTAKMILSKKIGIQIDDKMIDALCAELIESPEHFDIIIASNQYGDILADIGAAMVGGLGISPGASYGEQVTIFEATHGAAPDIAGKNIANPTAILLSACLMLKKMGEKVKAELCENAIASVLKDKKIITPDLGGNASTTEFTNAIVEKINTL